MGACQQCWHWSFPLHVKAEEWDGRLIPMRYEQWLLYHWHIVTHQGLNAA